MDNLLLEIGTEEIPAGYIEPALDALAAYMSKKLTDARLDHGRITTYGTPRRLAIIVEDVAGKQKSLTTEVIGPPRKVGFDELGNPTVAAEKFAEKVGVPLGRITVTRTPKGEYLCAKKTERGVAASTVLKKLLPEAILAIPFPKSMKWGDQNIYFARPVHHVVALLGKNLLTFNLGEIKSGRYTVGHSFMAPGRIKLPHADAYVKLLDEAHVIADFSRRRKAVEQEVRRAAEEIGGKVLEDEELLDTVTNLVEYPVATAGSFDREYLELPREILITAMRRHQKYFAVIDDAGDLTAGFVAVNNTRTRDLKLVATGHERVLRARLADAQFFYRTDLQTPLENRVDALGGVLFQAKLGSMLEKVKRVQELAGYLADLVDGGPDVKRHVLRAAWLCKADLVSEVVGEFPELQGVMGRVYASVGGEDDHVSTAIEEHYRPAYSGGPLPETKVGAILSIADKLDSICGCFSVGLVPTGASDPYALRRQGIGIILIMRKMGFTFSLGRAIEKSAMLFGAGSEKEIRELRDSVGTFLTNRMLHLLVEEGYARDVVAAVLSVHADCVPDIWNLVHALEDLKSAPDFEPLAAAFKRVGNIIRQAGVDPRKEAEHIDPDLFQHGSESELYHALEKVTQDVAEKIEAGLFDGALRDVATLRGPVDAFFDGVMVMAEDKRLRQNRLALLAKIAGLFGRFADFSKIST